MKLLVVASSYPHSGHPYSGIFNQKCVDALSKLCENVEVLAPRPYVPPLVSSVMPRWKAYAAAKKLLSQNGTRVSRPATPVIPHLGGAIWVDQSAFFWCRRVARDMHRRTRFDAILSFDLVGAGGLAWRIGRDLRIPASGWATGSDVRVPRSSSFGQSVIRALERLHTVFYQSHELFERAADLLDISPEGMSSNRHVVLARGIPEPPSFAIGEVRNHIRCKLAVSNEAILVLSVGRISRDKGIFELLEAASIAAARDSRIMWVVVGSSPAFDESTDAQKRINELPALRDRVKLLPACPPDEVWNYLCAADIFAFTSHKEGMPNSLLEAMVMGIPSVAFAIPPVLDIEAGRGGLVQVPPLDTKLFADAILRLAASPKERACLGEQGRSEVLNRFMVRKSMTTALKYLARQLD